MRKITILVLALILVGMLIPTGFATDSNVVITYGETTYSKEQLIAFGKEHYPRFYLIPRFVGIILLSVALLVTSLLGLVMLILKLTGVFDDPNFPIWVFFIPLGLFILLGISGIICIVVSFIKKSDEKYINHALAYLTKRDILLANKSEKEKEEMLLSKQDKETLERYNRLLKGGVISQEEYDKKKEELLK